MGTTRDFLTEYGKLTEEEKRKGEVLWKAYVLYFRRYQAIWPGTWDDLSPAVKLTYCMTAKSVKYAL